MTKEEKAEMLELMNSCRPNITQTMNFNAPIGQHISHVDKIEAHFDKDMNMVVSHAEEVNARQNVAEPKTSERPKKCFADYITDKKNKKSILEKFHAVVPGKKGKDLMLVMRTAVYYNILYLIPPHAVLEREFDDVGSRQSYGHYKDFAFLPSEMEPIFTLIST